MLKKEKPKYSDTSRFPKVATNGYEKEFKDNYKETAQTMLKILSSKMLNYIKK